MLPILKYPTNVYDFHELFLEYFTHLNVNKLILELHVILYVF